MKECQNIECPFWFDLLKYNCRLFGNTAANAEEYCNKYQEFLKEEAVCKRCVAYCGWAGKDIDGRCPKFTGKE